MGKIQVSIRRVIQLPQNSTGFCLVVFVRIIAIDAVQQQQERQNEHEKENRQE
jgi:hypothetical protein